VEKKKLEWKEACLLNKFVKNAERNESKEVKEIVDELIDTAKKFGTKVEFISTDTREGIQFKQLSGIGAFLRYKLT
jgi:peptide subunit release factor 1 (eRF1)